MTWRQHCDGPACVRADREELWTLTDPVGGDELHFCSKECMMRWSADVPAGIAAVEGGLL